MPSSTSYLVTQEDADSIAENVQGIIAVAPYSNSGTQVIASSQNMNIRITGVTVEYQQVFNIVFISGDFFTEYEYDRSSKIAVIGPTVASTLFGEEDPVGLKK